MLLFNYYLSFFNKLIINQNCHYYNCQGKRYYLRHKKMLPCNKQTNAFVCYKRRPLKSIGTFEDIEQFQLIN